MGIGAKEMSTVRCFLKGTKKEYEELFDKANVRYRCWFVLFCCTNCFKWVYSY